MIEKRLKSVGNNIDVMEGVKKLIGNAKTSFDSMGLPEEVAKKLKESFEKVEMNLSNVGNMPETPIRNMIQELETMRQIHKP